MTTQIQKQDIILTFEIPNLLIPYRRTSSSTVNKSYPLIGIFIFVYDIVSRSSSQITTDGKKNAIINGITDWVYEEEFAFVRAFDWSKDSKKLAYIRFDESMVPEFSMSIFKTDLYPTIETFKYPKAGEKNAVVSLHIFDVLISKLFLI